MSRTYNLHIIVSTMVYRERKKKSTTKSISNRIKGVLHCVSLTEIMLLCTVKKKNEKIETPGDVSIFLVNGEKKLGESIVGQPI